MIDYRSIMSGRRTDRRARVTRGVLYALEFPYALAVAARNRRYDVGSAPIHRCGATVISVGNLTTGGTGKTPIVCWLAEWFRRRGKRVVVISRGYGSDRGAPNDEALELAARLPDVPHVQNPDRVAAATRAVQELAADVILMDDGFQHRRLHRDLDILVIDTTCPFGHGHLLPRGLLREPIDGLRRADVVLLTRCDSVASESLTEIEQQIREVKPELPILRCHHRPTALLTFPDRLQPLEPANVAALSAIGNPDAFEQSLRRCGMTVVAAKQLPDHDRYRPAMIDQISAWVAGLGDRIEGVVCTHKDLVKLTRDSIGGKPLAALLIELTLTGETEPLESRLEALIVESSS